MWEVIVWLVFGGIVGWLASLIMKTDEQQGIIANVMVGIVGAYIGGYLFSAFGSAGITGFNFPSLLVALVGAILFIGLLKLVAGAFTGRKG